MHQDAHVPRLFFPTQESFSFNWWGPSCKDSLIQNNQCFSRLGYESLWFLGATRKKTPSVIEVGQVRCSKWEHQSNATSYILVSRSSNGTWRSGYSNQRDFFASLVILQGACCPALRIEGAMVAMDKTHPDALQAYLMVWAEAFQKNDRCESHPIQSYQTAQVRKVQGRAAPNRTWVNGNSKISHKSLVKSFSSESHGNTLWKFEFDDNRSQQMTFAYNLCLALGDPYHNGRKLRFTSPTWRDRTIGSAITGLETYSWHWRLE